MIRKETGREIVTAPFVIFQMTQETLNSLEKNYKRNYLSFLGEGLFFTFAYNLSSVTNVIPDYVAKISDDPLALSLIPVLYYCPLYLASILGCYFSLNARSPKQIGVRICLSQRIGLLLIALSSLLIGNAGRRICLTLFFIAFTLYNIADGMSAPVYYDMVSTMIHRNIGSFFGVYNMVGSIAGIFASLLLSYLYGSHPYPKNYQIMFFTGVIFAFLSSLMIILGCKETSDVRKEHGCFHFSQFPVLFRKCLSKPSFRKYTLSYLVLAATDFAVPFYVLRLQSGHPVPENYIGIMSMISLISGILANWSLGWISDLFGVFPMLLISCLLGIVSSILAIINPGGLWVYVTYAMISFAYCGSTLSNTIASAVFSEGENSTIYTASSKIVAAPVTFAVSVLGGFLSQHYSISIVFSIALTAYILAALSVFRKSN